MKMSISKLIIENTNLLIVENLKHAERDVGVEYENCLKENSTTIGCVSECPAGC